VSVYAVLAAHLALGVTSELEEPNHVDGWVVGAVGFCPLGWRLSIKTCGGNAGFYKRRCQE